MRINKEHQHSSSSRKSTYLILLFIILFSLTVTTSIRLSSIDAQSIISYDIIPNLLQAKRFMEMHSVNQTNFFSWGLKWVYNPKPIGFPILVAEFSMLGNTSFYYVGYFSLIWYILEILLIFMLSYKLFHSRKISLFASFLMATYLTGPSNQGPIYAHYANIDLIFFLIILISLLSIEKIFKKMVLISLSFAGIMVTHRPGLIFIFIFAAFLIFYSVVQIFIKKNTEFLKKITIPYLTGFVFGWDIAYVYWSHIKLENILLFGFTPFSIKLGSMPEFFLDILKMIDYPKYIAFLILINITSILAVVYTHKSIRIHIKSLEGLAKHMPKDLTFILMSFILPVVFGAVVIYVGQKMGVAYDGNIFKYFIDVWMAFAREAYNTEIVRILKQIFYIWHWNILPLFFLLPGLYIIFRNLKRNTYTAMLGAAVVLTLPIIWISQIYMSYTTVIERLYLYLAPFAYVVVAYAIMKFISLKPKKTIIKKIEVIFLCVLIIINVGAYVVYTTSFKEQQYDDKSIETFLFNKYHISPSFVFTGGGGDISKGNLYDQTRYRNVYPWWGTIPPPDTISRAKRWGVSYIYANVDPHFMPLNANPKYLDFSNYCWKIYSTDNRTVYLI